MADSIHSLVQDFFTTLGIQVDNIEIVQVEEDINIALQTPDSSLIIGMHGRSMDAFQHLIGRMIEKQQGKFVHVHLEVNDYIKQKEERLYKFLDSKVAFVLSTGKSIRIPNLTSYERKKAHNYVAEKSIEGLRTQSEGEGSERALVLSYTGELQSIQTHTTTQPVDNTLSEDGIGI